jgi:hypothetical protein
MGFSDTLFSCSSLALSFLARARARERQHSRSPLPPLSPSLSLCEGAVLTKKVVGELGAFFLSHHLRREVRRTSEIQYLSRSSTTNTARISTAVAVVILPARAAWRAELNEGSEQTCERCVLFFVLFLCFRLWSFEARL